MKKLIVALVLAFNFGLAVSETEVRNFSLEGKVTATTQAGHIKIWQGNFKKEPNPAIVQSISMQLLKMKAEVISPIYVDEASKMALAMVKLLDGKGSLHIWVLEAKKGSQATYPISYIPKVYGTQLKALVSSHPSGPLLDMTFSVQ